MLLLFIIMLYFNHVHECITSAPLRKRCIHIKILGMTKEDEISFIMVLEKVSFSWNFCFPSLNISRIKTITEDNCVYIVI